MNSAKTHYTSSAWISVAMFLFYLGFLNVVCADTKMYKQMDANGNITFTDTPPIDNTQTVEEIKINLHPSGVTLDKQSEQQESAESLEKLTKEEADKEAAIKAVAVAAKKNYTINITTPKTGQVFAPDTLEIVSGVALAPPLQPGDKLQVLLNNSPVLPPQTELAFKLPFLPAGNHELKVQIVSQDGMVAAESAPINITQMRLSPSELLSR
jgi:hypothetical protein